MNRCSSHPDQDTMVPCLGCGRYFCRICSPPSGAGQYCPRCYEESLAELEERRTSPLAAVRDFPGVGDRAEEGARPEGSSPRSPSTLSRFTNELKRVPEVIPGLPARAWSKIAHATTEHFPLVLSGVEKYEGEPRLRECWYKLAAVVLAGAATWTLVAALTHHRRPWVSIVIAFLVASGTVWSLGTRSGVMVGLLAMALALLSLAIGEILVQVLYRYGVIKSLDLPSIALSQAEYAGNVYRRFVVNVVILRFLLSAAVAFLAGWWPISKRIGWRGFRVSDQEYSD